MTSLVSIVDDDETVRVAVSSLVRSVGHDVCVFDSAEAFLASPRLEETSCLIADMQMPGMSGLDLQTALKARRPNLPVIIITAFPEPRIRQQAKAAGAIGFFSKPIDGNVLIDCLEQALNND